MSTNFDDNDLNKEYNIQKNKGPNIKVILIWVVIFLISRELFTNTKENAIINAPYYKEPEQIMLNEAQKKDLQVRVSKKNIDALIMPQASYKISARVIAKTRILGDPVSELIPYDIGLVWGELMKDKNYRKLKIRQYQRWVVTSYSADDEDFYESMQVKTHLSNNHMIPANDNVLRGIKKIKKFDKIYAEGYLVFNDMLYQGQPIQGYNSSLSRDDGGSGACEIFYVTKLITPRGTWE